ncbi:MAG: SDR family oxidoreductase [Endomicrobiales bacterium]
MIVVTGANGRLGRLVVKFLRDRVPVPRIAVSVREPEKAADIEDAGIEVRKADFSDRASVSRAFAGADKVLIVSTGGPNVVSEHRNAVEAAVEAGVKHIVYTSGIQAPSTFVAEVHRQAEEAIKASGLAYTFLRDNMYAEVLVWEVLGAVKAGVLSAPAGEGKVTAVTRADCAAAAAAVLSTDGHENRIYDITGPESIGWNDLAAIASGITGKRIAYAPVLPDTAGEGMVNVMMDYYRGISLGGYDVSSNAVAVLTGMPSTPVKAFVRQAALEALGRQG